MQEGGFLLGILGIVFVVLKLTHVIAWSWWWVLLPFYGGTALCLAILVVMALILGGVSICCNRFK